MSQLHAGSGNQRVSRKELGEREDITRQKNSTPTLFFDAIKKKKKKLLTIFPAAVGLSAAAMLSRYLPFRAIDFLTMS